MAPPTPVRAEPTRALFLYSMALEQYAYPPDCSFRTERAMMTRAILASMGLLTGPDRREVASEPASTDALAAAPRGKLDVEALHMGLGTARGWALAWSVLCGTGRDSEEMAAGLGGVMLESTDWAGGLRDAALPVAPAVRADVQPAVDAIIEKVCANVFPYHGLQA